jgi:hypothetical protein
MSSKKLGLTEYLHLRRLLPDRPFLTSWAWHQHLSVEADGQEANDSPSQPDQHSINHAPADCIPLRQPRQLPGLVFGIESVYIGRDVGVPQPAMQPPPPKQQ